MSDRIDWPQGRPLYDANWSVFYSKNDNKGFDSENLPILSKGTGDYDVDITAATVLPSQSSGSTDLSATTLTLSSSDSSNRRIDTIVYDVSAGSYNVLEGTAESSPEPPIPTDDDILIGFVEVEDGISNITSGDIDNWTQVYKSQGVGYASISATSSGKVIELDSGVEYTGELVKSSSLDANATYTFIPSDFEDSTNNIYSIKLETDGSANVSNTILQVDADNLNANTINATDVDISNNLNTENIVSDSDTTWDINGLLDINASQKISLKATELEIEGDDSDIEVNALDVLKLISQDRMVIEATNNLSLQSLNDVININLNELTNIVIENVSSLPTAGTQGRLVYHTGDTTVYVDDGSSWIDLGSGGGGGVDNTKAFGSTETGTVSTGNQGTLIIDSLQDGETLEIDKAALTLSTAEAAPSSLNMELVTFDNSGGYTTQTTIISGDGSTVHDRETGSPLASYTNSSGGAQTVGVIVDNQTGSDQDVMSRVEGTCPV